MIPFERPMPEGVAAELPGISIDTVRRVRRSRRIGYVMIGGKPRDLERRLIEYLLANGGSPVPHRPPRGEIGGYWLSRRLNSPVWYRTWFVSVSRQTRRASLGTDDLELAKLRLAEWVILNESRPGKNLAFSSTIKAMEALLHNA